MKRDDAVKCTAILQTSKNMDNPDMKEPHSHQPDENAITIAKCRDDMKRKAKLTLDKPNHIFTHANVQLLDDAKTYIPRSDTCKRILRKLRAQHRPREPQTLQELDIDGAWSMTMLQMLMNVS